jgi:hypothetical protein
MSYWDWLRQLTYQLYEDHYYEGFEIPKDKRFSIPNLNVMVSPLRMTQRRIKLTPNTDPYTKMFAPEGWASYGFDYLASFDNDYEETKSFGQLSFGQTKGELFYSGNGQYASLPFKYSVTDSFYKKGGYVIALNIDNLNVS